MSILLVLRLGRAAQGRAEYRLIREGAAMSNVQAADWSRRVREVEQLVAGGHHKQALQEAGSLLEGLLKELYRRTIDQVSPTEHKQISDKLEKLGKGKPVGDLTL